MTSEIRLWKIENDTPEPILQTGLNLEDRLENWMAQDIGMVSDELLVIGRQVRTEYGGVIDLLAMDADANLVILELKRDQTPRDIVAQTLDYASWVNDLDYEDVELIASGYLDEDRTLIQEFAEKFDDDLPEVVNENHRMYIVASSLDSSTERIVEYLSEVYGVDINVATFSYFKTPAGEELLGRSFLLNEQEIQREVKIGGTRRRPKLTLEELQEIAQENGVLELFNKAYDALQPLTDDVKMNRDSVAFWGRTNGRNRSICLLYPTWSSLATGLNVHLKSSLPGYFQIPLDELRSELSSIGISNISESVVNAGYQFDTHKLDSLIEFLRNAKEETNLT